MGDLYKSLLFTPITVIFILASLHQQSMRKEVIFAIILGVSLGAIILYGIYIANQATNQASPPTTSRQESSSPSPTPTPSPSPLTISSPTHNYVSFTNEIELIGTAPANTPIAIISEKDEEIIQSDNQGHFSTKIKLIGGENEIILTALIDNQPETQKITIIYTTAEINLD